MKKILLTLFTLSFVAAASPAEVNPAPAEAEVTQAITRLREGLVDSFNHQDFDRLVTFLDPNVVVTWQNGEVCEGAASIKAYSERMMKGDHPIVAKIATNPEVLGRHIQGDWAVSWGNLHDTFVLTDGRELPLNSHFTATIARRGDKWLVTAFHVSVNAFDNPVMSLAVKKISTFAGVAGLVAGIFGSLIVTRLLRRPKGGGAT